MLILGGTGFIGRHLSVALAERSRTAVVVSRTPDFAFLESHAPSVTAVELASMLDKADAYFAATDTLVYLASTSIPATFASQPWNELSANVQPAFELFHRAHKINPRIRVVYISSGGTIYGAGHSAPIAETAPAQPISAYGYGKLAVEEAIRFMGRTKGLSYAIIRASNPVGRWQDNRMHGVVTVALRAAHTGATMSLFDGGRQIRDFLDADDLAQAIITAADAPEFVAETWNIGSGIGRSISEVVDLVSEITGLPVHCTNLPGRAVDVAYSVLDCSKVKRDLGWSANIGLAETISQIERSWSEQQGTLA